MKILHILISAILITASIPFTSLKASATSNSCDDVHFVFARGSGAELNEKDAKAWRETIETRIVNSKLKYTFYELGTTAQNSYQYSATAVNGSFDGFKNLVGAKISNGESHLYGQSIDRGVNELKYYIENINSVCPFTKFVIGGYSQGAQVISKSLQNLDSNKIIYAATFGDPKIYLPEGGKGGMIPVACYGKELSDYRAYVPDCRAFEGILGSYQPYEPEDFYDKVGTWCNASDIMCSSKYSLRDHLSYDSDSLYWHASYIIFQKLTETFPAEIESGSRINTNQDTAILLDTTGSMGSYLKNYKEEALRLAKETVNKGGHVALIEYRDLYDPFEPVLHCDFSCTYEQFEDAINNMPANGGGDTAESFLSASMFALNNLNWHAGATKSIIALTDDAYLDPDRDGTTREDVVKRSLEIDPVNFYVITPKTSAYDDIATETSGATFSTTGDLSLSTDYVLNRPIASLPLSEYFGTPNSQIVFDASASSATSEIDHFEWDLDFDGIFESTTKEAKSSKTYSSPISGFMQVKVVDKNGLTSTMSANVVIEEPSSLASISNLNAKKLDESTFEINFSASENTSLVIIISNDSILGYTDTNNFVLSDVEYSSEIRLVPFSSDGIRGIASAITIGTSENPYTNFDNPHLNILMSDTDITATKTAKIFKVPNSGTR